ncbi:uncharacterized protein LOC118181056 [Stegodyphus dumicola]|uniref:uncharacterized protein LOC118181056 n=1 Tax=Stegodyphus dumicola TaxID=202533 RepID=UPI0015AF1D4D|nr:uncharacterized protein LOC118181056 [Stegodyphus dumicola]
MDSTAGRFYPYFIFKVLTLTNKYLFRLEAPVAGALDDNWSPTLILVTAIAAGAATAICVLCLAVSLQVLIKRRQSRSNTTVFHLGEVDSLSYRSGIKKHKPQESTNCTLDTYTEVIELRHKDHKTAPRKPRSALPHLPLDADPVYAQPFETTTAQHPMKKISTYSMGNKDDIYTAHIYAEPVDSRRPPSGTSNVSNSFTEAWFQAGTGKFRRKMSLPDCTSTFNDKVQHKSDDNFAAFYKLFSHPSTSSCLRPTSSEECQTELEPTKEIIFPELINNSIYLESSDRNISPENTERFQMIDNDIYLDNYFSHA